MTMGKEWDSVARAGPFRSRITGIALPLIPWKVRRQYRSAGRWLCKRKFLCTIGTVTVFRSSHSTQFIWSYGDIDVFTQSE